MVKKKISKVKKAQKPKETQNHQVQLEPEKRFDFGGLPKIDLKKNLGCG